MRHYFIICFLAICSICFANNDSISINHANHSPKNAPKSIAAPEIISASIYSNYVTDSFKIFVSKPVNYDESREKGYPVVFYLDGNGLVYHTIAQELTSHDSIPEVIVVSIGYVTQPPFQTLRTRDYTYGYSNFYDFVRNELIPFIQESYFTDSSLYTLFGHSYGGLCGFNFVFGKFVADDFPFKNVVSSSPSLTWPDFINDDYCRGLESTFYKNNYSLPINLYMTMGSLEVSSTISYFTSLALRLHNRKYEEFNFRAVENSGYTHDNNRFPSFRQGLPWVFSKSGFTPNGIKTIVRNSEIKISPNPSSGIFNITTRDAINKDAIVEINDYSGKLIFSKALENGKIDLTGYKKGIYIAKIFCDNKVFTEKIVIK